jgi:hypothetical protein
MSLGQLDPYNIEDTSIGENDADYYMLLPPRLLGFFLQSKFWGQFMVESTTEGSSAGSFAFMNYLQLDSRAKQMILALLEHHENQHTAYSNDHAKGLVDIVDNKG